MKPKFIFGAAAKICGAPVPPPAVLGRAVSWQGLCCVIAGLFGTANGTTAYNENIGAMQVFFCAISTLQWCSEDVTISIIWTQKVV